MKKPLRLLFYSILTLAVLASLAYYFAPEKFFEGKGGEEGEGLPGVFLSMGEWSDARTYPHKSLDKLAYYRGFETAKQMTIAARNAQSRQYSTTTAPWVPLAPKNFAGRVLSIGFHPTVANTMWVGTAAGGLWKTTTGGTGAPGGINWTYVPTGYPVLGVMSIAVHPTDGNTLYIGSGEVYNPGAPGMGPTAGGHIRTFRGTYGIGILKTTDGGTTWNRVLNFDSSQSKGVADILIHPTNPDIVFAATSDGVYRTLDGGGNWSLIHNVTMAMDLCFKPGNPSITYIACGNFDSPGRGIYKTTNSTAATPTISAINTGLPGTITGKIALSVSAAAPNSVWASVGREPDSSDPFGLYVSTNEGGTWSLLEDAIPLMYTPGLSRLNQGWYAHDVAVDPTNTNNIYWCEMDMWRSTNAGSSFSRISVWSNWNINFTTVGTTSEGTNTNYAHADVHRIYISPWNSNTLYICTDGGIFRSTNNGTSWSGLNGGLMTAQIYPNMGQSMQDENFAIGGLQDNEGFVYEGNAGCRRIGNLGDGFHAAIHPTNDATCFIASYYLNIKKSTNRAASFSNNLTVNPSSPPSENACFNAPYVMAPSAPATMYAGTYRLRKTTNTGTSWALIGPNPLVHTQALILYIAVAPSDANTLYVSVAPGGGFPAKLMKSTNGGTSFTDVTGTLPDRYITDIAIDGANPNRVAVSLSGFNTSHVFLTRDGGTTWTDVGGDLPDIPHNTLMFDPINRRTLYVGNDLGVFYAHGMPVGTGALPPTTSMTWTAYNEGIEDAVLVSDLFATGTGKLRIATFGRGMWEREFAPSSILPFVFKNFTATATGEGNQLKWTVATEGDVDRYEVEYGTDGTLFRKVGTHTATGGAGDITYNFFHAITNDMDGFYRIKIIYKDGSFEYSTVAVVKAQKLITKLTIAPNPTTGIFKIKIPADNAGALTMQLYDAGGKLLMVKRIEYVPGAREVPVDISRFAAGTYQLVCEGYKAKWTSRIIKK
ncbi:MAG TPA: T9SS type A sorting domain-containing protein [Chitinophagaceae bacterium]|nr:T9SS type A sorting domain-containing protein [Chitinophagaceae bacterium]